MRICLDAGHYLGTPGKRCLKSIDPGETREWTLNSRIAEKVQKQLEQYRCTVLRADDVTGKRDVSLAERVAAANEAGADVYLSIHHNAGINGGSGGGVVVFVHPDAGEEAVILQQELYRQVVERTGLKGNRANPTPTGDYYVLRKTAMTAVLGEFGFMDSTTDTPVILTEEFAEQAAEGIAAALVKIYGLEETELTREEIRALIREEIARMEEERAGQKASPWAGDILKQAAAKGITDGSRPQSWATRQEVAAMVNAAVK